MIFPQGSLTVATIKGPIAYDHQSVADLAKVIKYFKGQGKRIHVLGISFGAFMTQELLNIEGSNIADDYLIMVIMLLILNNLLLKSLGMI